MLRKHNTNQYLLSLQTARSLQIAGHHHKAPPYSGTVEQYMQLSTDAEQGCNLNPGGKKAQIAQHQYDNTCLYGHKQH
jgi:hypothetical protein